MLVFCQLLVFCDPKKSRLNREALVAISAVKKGLENSFSFSFLKNDAFFFKKIEDLLGTNKTKEILSSKALKAEVLLQNDKEVLGVIVYEKELFKIEILNKNKQLFKVNNFGVIGDHNQNQTTYQALLFERCVKLAKRVLSDGILFDISDQSKDIKFSNDFKLKKIECLKSKNNCFYHLIKEDLEKANDHKKVSKRSRSNSPNLSDSEQRPSKLQKTEKLPTLTDSIKKKQETSFYSKTTELSDQRSQVSNYQARPLNRSKSEPYLSDQRKNSTTTHSLPMKGTIYFDYIMSGQKKFEGRVCGHQCNLMKSGDLLKMFDSRAGWGIICEITSVDKYKGFEEMLRAKGVLNMLPQLSNLQRSEEDLIKEGVKVYQSFPGAQRVRNAGAVAIGVKYLRKV